MAALHDVAVRVRGRTRTTWWLTKPHALKHSMPASLRNARKVEAVEAVEVIETVEAVEAVVIETVEAALGKRAELMVQIINWFLIYQHSIPFESFESIRYLRD